MEGNFNTIAVMLVATVINVCSRFQPKTMQVAQEPTFKEMQQFAEPADKKATDNTKELLSFLKEAEKKQTIIGHQDDLAYGNGWRFNKENPKKYISDIYNSCGDFPGIFGWDLGQIERKINNPSINYLINGVLIDDVKTWSTQIHSSGGINMFSWHMDNIVNGGTSFNNGDGTTVCKLLQRGSQYNINFNKSLDLIADFFLSLKDDKGQLIPVLFRPFHEANMTNCFWWNVYNTSSCPASSYKELYRYVKIYLSEIKQVHNVLYVFSLNDNCISHSNEYEEEESLESRYPGDNYVDVIGLDIYIKNKYLTSAPFEKIAYHVNEHNRIITNFSRKKNKIAAITEFGWENNQYLEGAFTSKFSTLFEQHNFSFILFWRNPDKIKDFTCYYSVYPEHPNAENFKVFYQTTKKYVFLSNLKILRENNQFSTENLNTYVSSR